MNDIDVIDEIKRAVGPVPEPPAYRTDLIRHRARRVRQQRWSEAIGSAALVVAIVGGVVAVGGRAAPGTARVVDVLSVAEAGIAEAGTARMVMTSEMKQTPSLVDTPTMRVEGEIDFRAKASRMRSSGQGEVISVGGTRYREITEAERTRAAGRLDGKRWVSEATGGPTGDMFEELARPEELIAEMRRVAGDPVREGTEKIRGVATTVYAFDLAGMFDDVPQDTPGMGAMTMTGTATLAIDADGLPRRFTIRAVIDSAAAQVGKIRVEFLSTIEFYDYGKPVGRIAAPPASEVVDAMALQLAVRSGHNGRPRTVEECMQAGPNTSREKCEAMYGSGSAGERK